MEHPNFTIHSTDPLQPGPPMAYARIPDLPPVCLCVWCIDSNLPTMHQKGCRIEYGRYAHMLFQSDGSELYILPTREGLAACEQAPLRVHDQVEFAWLCDILERQLCNGWEHLDLGTVGLTSEGQFAIGEDIYDYETEPGDRSVRRGPVVVYHFPEFVTHMAREGWDINGYIRFKKLVLEDDHGSRPE